LLKDFKDEVVGYLNNASICEELAALELKPGAENIAENIKLCYELLIRLGLIGKLEMPLIDAWLSDCNV